MATVPKAVKVYETTDQPRAECAGIDDKTGCPQNWSHDPYDAADDSRRRAKRHAEVNPGHRVRVITETREIYVAQ
jgi:hypothetical protein